LDQCIGIRFEEDFLPEALRHLKEIKAKLLFGTCGVSSEEHVIAR